MIDFVIYISYILLSLAVGIYFRSRSKTLKGYSHLGKDINNKTFILVATIFASAVGGGTTFGITEKAFSHNLAYAYGLILTIPVDILIAKYIVPKLVEYREKSSIGEILGAYYGQEARIIIGIASLLICSGYLSVQISVSGRIFSDILGIDYISALLFSYFAVIIYTSIGGLRSVVLNNTIQFVAMIIAIPLVTFIGIKTIGLENFINTSQPYKYDILSSKTLIEETIYAALSFSVMGLHPSFIQRILSGSDSDHLTKAIYYKSGIYLFFVICLSLNGLIADHLIPEVETTESVMSLVNYIIPEGIKGIVVIGLIGAVMSTADSDLNVAAISVSNDIFCKFNIASSKYLLVITKLVTVLIGSTVILFVISSAGIVDTIIFSSGFWSPVAFVPIIALMLGKTISKKGFFITILSGSSWFIFAGIYCDKKFMSNVFCGTLFSAIIFSLFYILEQRKLRAIQG